MQTISRTTFTTVKTEGAILPADLLQRIAEGRGLEGLSPEDYHLAPSERLNEAVNRSWNRLLGVWQSFDEQRGRLPASDSGVSLTRERWLLILFQELGYGRLAYQGKMTAATTLHAGDGGGVDYPISHGWGHTPIHLASFRQDLDRREGAAGGARSPHSLLQEFLNRDEASLWGFVSNGLRLRVLRDNVSLTRAAFVEFDLEAMMTGESYADFALLWLVCHQSRVEGAQPSTYWLERWSQNAAEQGTRALEALRGGVQDAISALGRGFLAHPANGSLRGALKTGQLSTDDYYRQLLRLVYRLIFLFVAEDRDLLLVSGADAEARTRYHDYYSLARLRSLAEARRGGPHPDLYRSLRLVGEKLREGYPPLGLPALGSFLFSDKSTPALDAADLANLDLLNAIRALAFTEENRVRRPVDCKNLGAEELGSVYESLLELQPQLNVDAGAFDLAIAAGSERKTTGSYYTPTSLINCLLDSALEPVVADRLHAAKRGHEAEAILSIRVVDPAAGSGHFLIAAAHRLARHLARARTGDEEPSPVALRAALRDVVRHCIHGVDINPMAVELCKVALWMESLDPGKPLSFLDRNIQCGNSLIGATPRLLDEGIPDEAFTPITGDDKSYCSEFKKRNKKEREGQHALLRGERPAWERLDNLAAAMAGMDRAGDETLQDVRRQQELYDELVRSSDYRYGRLLADAWCTAFTWKKTREFAYPMTEEVFRQIERNPFNVAEWMEEEIGRLRDQYQFFHWHLAFPNVFVMPSTGRPPENESMGWNGGFDIVLGNPPWDKIQPEEQKFFASTRPDIALAETPTIRKRLIENLPVEDPLTNSLWLAHKRHIDAVSHTLRDGRFLPLTSQGNLNSYRLFAELANRVLGLTGRVGLIVQTGLATDESGKEFFLSQLRANRILRFLDFENHDGYFPDVDSRFRFALVVFVGENDRSAAKVGEFGWLLRNLAELDKPGRLIRLTADDVLLFNPGSGTAPMFLSQRDFLINRQMYAAGRHIHAGPEDRFEDIDFLGELFNMTRAAALFVPYQETTPSTHLPLYEAKYIHQFDHRFASFAEPDVAECHSSLKLDPQFSITTRHYVPLLEVKRRTVARGMTRDWMLGFRDIASPTNERTAIFGVFPFSAVGNNINLVLGLSPLAAVCLLADVNSYAFDYACRQKVSGMHVNIWILKQLPVVPFSEYGRCTRWGKVLLSEWILPRAIELTFTAWDLQPFAHDCGYDGPPFRWDAERRFLLRCELDAACFHLHGIAPDDVDYIMDTFPIVRRKDEATYGEYRTKRVILEMYDEMAEAMRTGEPYRTHLDPPPADPRVAHPPREGGESSELESAWAAQVPGGGAPVLAAPVTADSERSARAARRTRPAKPASAEPRKAALPKHQAAAPRPEPAQPALWAEPPAAAVPAVKVPTPAPGQPAIPAMPAPQGTTAERRRQIMAARDAQTPEAFGTLIAALGDEDGQNRWLASFKLETVGGPAIRAALKELVANAGVSAVAWDEALKLLSKVEE